MRLYPSIPLIDLVTTSPEKDYSFKEGEYFFSRNYRWTLFKIEKNLVRRVASNAPILHEVKTSMRSLSVKYLRIFQ